MISLVGLIAMLRAWKKTPIMADFYWWCCKNIIAGEELAKIRKIILERAATGRPTASFCRLGVPIPVRTRFPCSIVVTYRARADAGALFSLKPFARHRIATACRSLRGHDRGTQQG
jgi:hypothetical protein